MSDGEVKRGRRRAGDTRARMVSITVKLDAESAAMLADIEEQYNTQEYGYVDRSSVIRHRIAVEYAVLMGLPRPVFVAGGKHLKVYFIRLGTDGPIKIGKSFDVESRLAQLQQAHAEELRVLATIAATSKTESEFHDRFAATRIRGEWFSPSEELLAFIRQVQ